MIIHFTGVLIFLFFFFVLHIALCVWGYRDSIRRGRSNEYAIIVLVGLLFFPVVGLIVYLIIRND
ncbi:PLDc N-terminal domain-containing protein [Paenibacillus contaminans]|uniref:Cardiolipin synthase N-terminal domain-containing protein n=1 Tax=Paenibacillus contaminans TaxID=450362 RepID=A0A329MLV3_9BACL|nr:PLDc N-terminal domain-containing protein [Paenibacillus contaminans]RAV18867.1 hypothetical protein DQG23_24375 [Paenibacillus contaminans]